MRVLIPLPDRDFDVTEVSVPWQSAATRHEVGVATEHAGAVPAGDPVLATPEHRPPTSGRAIPDITLCHHRSCR